MLDSISAVSYRKTFSSGRNNPLLLDAERKSGEFVQVVAKLASAECKASGLVREAIAAVFAADLEMRVPEPFVVEFSREFVQSVTDSEVRSRLEGAGPSGFGSLYVPMAIQVTSGSALRSDETSEAVNVFGLDGGILNPDRRPAKPNCLRANDVLWLIDHELAFLNAGLLGRSIVGPQAPWEPSGLRSLTTSESQHLFYEAIQGIGSRPNELCKALAKISDSRVDEYANAIPPQWIAADFDLEGLIGYIKQLITKCNELASEVEHVLAA